MSELKNVANKDKLIEKIIKENIFEEKRLIGKIVSQIKLARNEPKIRLNLDEKQLRLRLDEIIKKWERKKVVKIIEKFLEEIKLSLRRQEMVSIWGLFSLKVNRSQSRKARNPRNNKIIIVPEKNRISFRASSKLKKEIN